MIEIVFSESAAGGLKIAQSYGKGKYHGGCTAVFIGKTDGGKPTAAEIEAARFAAEEKERCAWEDARPIGGSPGDVFCFDLALGFGSISRADFWDARLSALRQLSACRLDQDAAQRRISEARKNLAAVLERCADEPVRIWTSDQSDEACGMCWMLSCLVGRAKELCLVKLPCEAVFGDSLRRFSGWGEVLPEEWSHFLRYEEALSDLQIRARAYCWRELQEQDMPLRALVGGRLISLGMDVYDHFIRMEIDCADSEFRQARVIGNVLGRHLPGVGDGFIALRMEEMIRAGELEIIEAAGEGEPSYRRILKKVRHG